MNDQDASAQLTEFLVKADGYRGKSPLMQRVETEISAMARTIAAEVVAENPGLTDKIRERTRHVVAAALRDDAYLNGLITQAVAKVITERALQED